MTGDLVDRVLAVIKEQESRVRAALAENTEYPWEELPPHKRNAKRFPFPERVARMIFDGLHRPWGVLRRCEADRRTVERHRPTWPDGKPEYGSHWETTESGGTVTVQNAEPDAPYWCDTCSVPSPCPELLDRAQAYDVDVN